MAITITEIGFRRGEHQLVVAAMRRLEQRGDGEGWINVKPWLTDEEDARVPDRTNLGDFFSGRGPAVSMGTWMPATRGRKPRPAQVGVEHGTGPKALDRLAEVGVELPQGWFKRQDHAKHGIVAELPDGVDPSSVVAWLVTVATELRTVVYPGDEWVAIVHEPA